MSPRIRLSSPGPPGEQAGADETGDRAEFRPPDVWGTVEVQTCAQGLVHSVEELVGAAQPSPEDDRLGSDDGDELRAHRTEGIDRLGEHRGGDRIT